LGDLLFCEQWLPKLRLFIALLLVGCTLAYSIIDVATRDEAADVRLARSLPRAR
jgi:hypothetical protein